MALNGGLEVQGSDGPPPRPRVTAGLIPSTSRFCQPSSREEGTEGQKGLRSCPRLPTSAGTGTQDPSTTSPLLEKAPKSKIRGALRCRQPGGCQRSPSREAESWGAGCLAQGWRPTRAVSQGWGGPSAPSSPGNLSGQHASGGSHGARSGAQEAGRLSPLEKGALLPCPSGRRESRRALGILTARRPNKTQGPRRPLPPAH